MSDTASPIVEMRGISKRYGGVQALTDVDLELYTEEVHALVGDNAAGKSTLIKILAGAVARDAGVIRFQDLPAEIDSPRAAKALGIETVYQDLALADNLDVAANMFLGREIVGQGVLRPFLDIRRMEEEARKVLARLKINIPSIRQKVRSMSGGQRQSIAIARSVYFNAKVVILDEPTAALGVEETRKVHELVREMRSHGLAVLMISHNLNHVFENSDRITVLKTGRVVGTRRVAETSREEILRMIVTGTAEGHGQREPKAEAV
ncbi:MAG: ATP-binding cassette domain-containing protein [Hyphomicrobiaceae bacterium]